jgi:hypothetical protein
MSEPKKVVQQYRERRKEVDDSQIPNADERWVRIEQEEKRRNQVRDNPRTAPK